MKSEQQIRALLAMTENNAPLGNDHNRGVQDALRWVLDED